MRSIEEARQIISGIDKEMAELFMKRMEVAADIAAYKKDRGLQVLDEGQEKKVLERNAKYIPDEIIRQYYLTFMKDTMAVSRKYQERLIEGARAAFCGTEGAFAHIAAKKIFPGGRTVAFSSFDAAYLSVVEGECDYAVLPIENSYAGEVGQVIDLMFHGSLFVNGVYSFPIIHNLLGIEGAQLGDIRTVISHPQALTQCRPYIRSHYFREEVEDNTAVAAKRVAKTGDPTLAAIASGETAGLYGLKVLDHDINESKDNTTKFAVFSRTKNEEIVMKEGSTFIMLFRVNNVAGALARTLHTIGKYGFNLNVLRSRPIKTTPWKYYFYAEAEGNPSSENGQDMIRELRDHCDMLKIAGQYTRKVEDTGFPGNVKEDGEEV